MGRIRLPGEPKASTTINNSGMVNSLKQVLSSHYFDALTPDNQVKILEAYWRGVSEVLPDCFDTPIKYTIQKSTGVTALHTFLLSVIEHVRAAGNSVIERDSYRRVLDKPLTELEGDNCDGSPVQGSDFWFAGVHGAAGSFSSNAAAASFWLNSVICCPDRGRVGPIRKDCCLRGKGGSCEWGAQTSDSAIGSKTMNPAAEGI